MREKYFIESNGQVYGPADLDQLIQWVAEGRVVSSTTLINQETAERIPAGDHAELRSWFAPTQPNTPSTGSTSYQVPPPQGRAGDYGGMGGGVGGYPGGYQQQQQRQPPHTSNSPQYAPPGYGAPMYGDVSNDSGRGSQSRLPAELQGVNIGAFGLPILWGIFNQSYLGLLAFIPGLSWIISLVMLFKGNEWAWQNRRFESIEQFRQVQQAWKTWGIVALVFNIISSIIWFLSLFGNNTP